MKFHLGWKGLVLVMFRCGVHDSITISLFQTCFQIQNVFQEIVRLFSFVFHVRYANEKTEKQKRTGSMKRKEIVQIKIKK